ncbi:MAG: glycosyltransferase family 39 protein [Pseudomonas sp.]
MELLAPRKGTDAHPLFVFVRDFQVVPILALALALRLYGITQATLWYDEGFSVLVSAYSPALIWFHSAQDVHPPLYYMLLHGWNAMFGNSVFAVRAMSVLAGLTGIVLGQWWVSLIATRRAAIVAGLILALLPIAVRYSQEARMYALVSVWLMGASIALIYWVKNPQRYRPLVIYVLLMSAAFYTHYFAALGALSHWLYLLVLPLAAGKKGAFITRPAWWLANVVIVVCYLPWIPSIIDQFSHVASVDWIPPASRYTLPSTIWQYFTLDEEVLLPWPVYVAFPLLMLLLAIWTADRDKGAYRFYWMLGIYTLVPLLVVYGVSLKLPLFSPRYFVFAAMGLPLVLGIALDQWALRFPKCALLALVLLIGLQGGGLFNLYTQNNKMNDPIHELNNHVGEMMTYINQHFESGDRLVVYGLYWYLSVVYYNHTASRPLLYTPLSTSGASTRPGRHGAGTLFFREAGDTYIDTLSLIPADTRRVWLMYGNDAEGHVAVPQNWNRQFVMNFGDTQLRLYSIGPVLP